MNLSLLIIGALNINWIGHSQRPTLLSYCCRPGQTMPLSHYTRSVLTQWKIHCRAKRKLTTCRQTRQSRLLLVWNKVSQLSNLVIFKEIQTINTVLWLFNVSWQITVLPYFKHVHRSSFHIYVKHEMYMNKHQKVFYFNRGTHHFLSVSPPKVRIGIVVSAEKGWRLDAGKLSRNRGKSAVYIYTHLLSC